ncbi:hypothetical protein [uncultured Sphingomonas sp.]|uniref:hypothetical protein n=1 Tax=uncultured Sphingomonas sp. TaxID=158754 RepID=UPI0035CBA078
MATLYRVYRRPAGEAIDAMRPDDPDAFDDAFAWLHEQSREEQLRLGALFNAGDGQPPN